MIAGGSGITPMLQIARDVFKNSSENTKISLLFANKSEEDILLRDEIEKMKTDHPEQFNVMFTINAAKD
jgi:NAD(P)H-flavin reductase